MLMPLRCAAVFKPQGDSITASIETNPIGVMVSDGDPTSVGGRKIRGGAPRFAPIESGAFVGDLQAQPAPPQPQAQACFFIRLPPIPMQDGVVQTFPRNQFHRKTIRRHIVCRQKSPQFRANRVYSIQSGGDSPA
jgi:hypothetical protein